MKLYHQPANSYTLKKMKFIWVRQKVTNTLVLTGFCI